MATVITKNKKVPSDIEIAQAAKLKPINDIAASLGIQPDEVENYGKYKAKIDLSILERLKNKPNGKYIDVTAITPTPLGEGKTTTTIGLGMGMNRIGKKTVITIRQPSLGPVFGIKGGAAGGGYSQIVPMEDFNLHLTGDNHAVSVTHNLLSAFIDNHLMHGNKMNIDPFSITWPRVVDISDRALRNIIIGLGGKDQGVPRETGFDICVASEVMAILALATSLKDMRERLGRIIIGSTRDGKPVSAEDLKCAGAMTVLMKDALKPNLLQTLENTPAFVHSGPFGNIAHGNSSIVADQVALKCADFVITESGFGADLGAEKFMNIKCRYSGLTPNAAVIVATVRALKMHGGVGKIVAGKPLPDELVRENIPAVEKGCENLIQMIENMKLFGIPSVVAINTFHTDTRAEIEAIKTLAREYGAEDAIESNHWARGGAGAEELAEAVVAAAQKPSKFGFLYPLEASIEEKMETIATKVYGADGIDILPVARKKIKQFNEWGPKYTHLPICMAKTHLSLSHDPTLLGRPRHFTVPIRDIKASVGAGFLYALLGDMRTMPGLPSKPAGEAVDIDVNTGKIVGLF
ncbi:MAG: formate--tetrahydrofolate ligase [Planctomycetes bacterium RIFCSPLOWO2_12_FULL_50_35]|nr:MAG: formate--tetrahydrofolate ligase [Planctomycetes bacterium RIFCSPHIGHO2_12_FULL_51_37]OHC02823.1 MAG: formate--tetrahydrofolate ligase [Planctomycetes bacterium RIFCSPLOWO2_12_FULL_50_35]